jgi:hypothetical protein
MAMVRDSLRMNTTNSFPVTIRAAYPDDAPALWRLAALDSASVPAEPLLVAETDGQLRVAVSMSDLNAIADPFVPTAHVVEMLRDHIARTADEPFRQRRFAARPVPATGLRTV